MYATAPQSLSRRFARHLLAVLGLAALLLAAGIDTAEAATGALDAAFVSATTWLSFAALAVVLLVAYRRNVPSRARRIAIARRRRVARTARR